MTNWLSIETSTEQCSVALQVGAHLKERCLDEPRIHSRILLPWISELLDEAALDYSQLDGIVVGVGPGGFTSLRIGLSVAQGLALAHELPIYPVSSLLNVACACEKSKQALVIMDARMGEFYTQAFIQTVPKIWKAVNEPRVCSPESVCDLGEIKSSSSLTVLGTGVSLCQSVLRHQLSGEIYWDSKVYPMASRALELREQSVAPWALQASYVRNQVTTN